MPCYWSETGSPQGQHGTPVKKCPSKSLEMNPTLTFNGLFVSYAAPYRILGDMQPVSFGGEKQNK